jgi:hypothetical protein
LSEDSKDSLGGIIMLRDRSIYHNEQYNNDIC